MAVVNNRETSVGDTVYYIDQAGDIFEPATITALQEQDGNHFAEIEYTKDGQPTRVTWVPHNTSPEKHSWNHQVIPEQAETE
jgi:hypothetical protein